MDKVRLDLLMEESRRAESRSLAQRLIMAGQVRVNGQVVLKPATRVLRNDTIDIDQPPPFVSRGGEKLLSALKAFNLTDLAGMICVDVGASTGGFTDCLLQHGAAKIFAVDVGYGVLHYKLRGHPKIVVMERTNARYVAGFDDPIDLVTVDASFISLRTLLPVIKSWIKPAGGQVIALIKPQFEAGRKDSAKGEGVIRDAAIHRRVIEEVLTFAQQEGFSVKGLIRSPLLGPKGNTEFLLRLEFPASDLNAIATWIEPLFAAKDGQVTTENQP